MFEGFEQKMIDTGDVKIACAIAGSGAPLLLLHGFPQNRYLWARVAPILAANFTVVCADLRGYGDSDKPRHVAGGSTYSFRAMAADQLGLMRALGFERFHLAGHDRGGRTAHRLALDHPGAVLTLTVMDIVPTVAMFANMNREVAQAYWHWQFLAQPEPFPERLIEKDPDFFYETCLTGWGRAQLADFDRAILDAYRRSWRDPAMIHGSSSDYRAAAGIDLEHDKADIGRKVTCPVLVAFGASGTIAGLFDIPLQWRERCTGVTEAALPGGHFFVDQLPEQTAEVLAAFVSGHA